jgi:hypothetical protein
MRQLNFLREDIEIGPDKSAQNMQIFLTSFFTGVKPLNYP